jgi:DNA-binding IclR family transcriptional regulator
MPARAVRSSPERVLDMLLSFTGPDAAQSVHDLAHRFGTSRSSTYRYLQMLRARGLVEEGPAPGQFRLGSRLLTLTRAAPIDLAAVARPVMRALAVETGETVLLTRRQGVRVVMVECVESPRAVRIAFEPARNTPLHAGSAARIHLAHLDPDEIEAVLARPLERLTAHTPADPAALRRELALIRRRGYATSEGEVDPDVRSVSAPVPGTDGGMVAGLTVAGPRFRLTRPAARALAPRLIAAARAIAGRLARSGDGRPPA